MIRLSKRGLGITLIVSLGINLFLAGMIVTAAIYHKDGRGWGGGYDRAFPHWSARRALDGKSRDKVDTIWREARPDLRKRLHEVRRARREIRRQLRADTLDRAALDRAFAALRASTDGAHIAMHALIGRIAETLNAEERRSYFRRRHWRRHRRFRRHRE
ncbi:MAG: periplasmic heavy metal sensor [Alphaproteobacteria bacterium]